MNYPVGSNSGSRWRVRWVASPRLMLLDEPFSALDAGLREATRQSVARVLREAGIATVLVTHDQVEALSFAEKVGVLREGRMVQFGPPQEVYSFPADRDTASLLGDAILLPAHLGDGWVDCALGRIPARVSGRRGTGEIMLRPEQVRLVPEASPPPTSSDPSACHARVMAVEFGGSARAVMLSLKGTQTGPKPALAQANVAERLFNLRTSAMDAPAAGDRGPHCRHRSSPRVCRSRTDRTADGRLEQRGGQIERGEPGQFSSAAMTSVLANV